MGSLVSQIIHNNGSLSSNQINVTDFSEMRHRSGDLVLTKIIADYLFFAGIETGGNRQTCEFAVMAKPISEGDPVNTDLITANEKYIIGKTHRKCQGLRDQTNSTLWADELHIDVSLQIKIPLDWQAFFVVLNGIGISNSFAYLVRLFWTLI